MYVIFDAEGITPRASLTKSEVPGERSFAIEKDLYLEIMNNPFVLRELTLTRKDKALIVERITSIARSNQTMEPMAMGRDGDIVLAIKWHGMAMEYASHVRKVSTHEFNFCTGSVLNPLCDPVKLSHGTIMQMEYILPEDKLPFRADLFAKASVFVARPYVNFRYTYYLDF
jgi:hypothetical protein